MSEPSALPSTILVADIGGTNARFALTTTGEARPPLHHLQQVATADFASLSDALRGYLREHHGKASRAVIAVASPVAGDAIKITNNPWAFSIRQLAVDIGMPVEVINDFTAMASVLPALQRQDLESIGDVPPPAERAESTSRCYAVVGPGTGLGVGGVIVRKGHAAVIQSEGGHVGFAPGTPFEIELLRVLLPRFGRVSAERLISGSGLSNLHQAVCEVEGLASTTMSAAEISAAARENPDSPSARTLSVFAELLGSFAGDVALALGAWDGVLLPGGVTQKLLPWIEAGGFRRRFEDKGRHSAILKRIPTDVIVHPQAGLLGAAVHAVSG